MARDKSAEAPSDETLEEGAGPRVYELGFHLDPELPQEEVKKAYQTIRSAVETAGSIVAEAEPEKVQLAYTISRQETAGRRDFDSAFFSWIAYESDVERHASVVSAASSDKRIVRFIDLLTTKDAARHSAEMREMQMSAEGGSASGGKVFDKKEESSDAELDAAIEGAVPA